ncbi:MAG: hypothetical protein GXY36_12240 [Chloroflexi bacterium]|nr:hypothetical protein [Chloroflexota bacterium]
MFEGFRGCCLSVLIIPLLCCVLAAGAAIFIYASAPEPPVGGDFRPTIADANTFNNALNQAASDAMDGGVFSLSFDEVSLSSWIALNGADLARERGYSFPFTDVQVGLDDDVMTFYGRLTTASLNLPVEIVIEPRVDAAGHLDLNIQEAHLGALGVPPGLLGNVTRELEDTLTRTLTDLNADYRLSDPITVDNGRFTAYGQVQGQF